MFHLFKLSEAKMNELRNEAELVFVDIENLMERQLKSNKANKESLKPLFDKFKNLLDEIESLDEDTYNEMKFLFHKKQFEFFSSIGEDKEANAQKSILKRYHIKTNNRKNLNHQNIKSCK
jgi:ATP-dependent Lon protease